MCCLSLLKREPATDCAVSWQLPALDCQSPRDSASAYRFMLAASQAVSGQWLSMAVIQGHFWAVWGSSMGILSTQAPCWPVWGFSELHHIWSSCYIILLSFQTCQICSPSPVLSPLYLLEALSPNSLLNSNSVLVSASWRTSNDTKVEVCTIKAEGIVFLL